jgi:hypothetical protein
MGLHKEESDCATSNSLEFRHGLEVPEYYYPVLFILRTPNSMCFDIPTPGTS